MQAFLSIVCSNQSVYDGIQIDTIAVDVWSTSKWGQKNIVDLIFLCRKHAVKRLIFVPSSARTTWRPKYTKNCAHLPLLLKEIVVHHNGNDLPHDLQSLFFEANIASIRCIILTEDRDAIRSRVRSFYDFVYSEKWLKHAKTENLTVRKISCSSYNGPVDKDLMPPKDFIPAREVIKIVESNRRAWRNCCLATILLVSKRNEMLKPMDINVRKMIAQQVWATRQTKVWKSVPHFLQELIDRKKK
uniref:Uncharacterized protein n=1 Tax=viral metagenome TaxID=1070528 RepID=A0A6C0CH54_9ZZZZ